MVKANRPDAPPLDKASDAGPRPAPKEYRTGPEIIADYVKNLSQGPGVYRMYGEDGEVLYVARPRSSRTGCRTTPSPAGTPIASP